MTDQENTHSPDFDKAEQDLLRNALKRSYEERFLVMTRLMKAGRMFKSAKVTHKVLPTYKK